MTSWKTKNWNKRKILSKVEDLTKIISIADGIGEVTDIHPDVQCIGDSLQDHSSRESDNQVSSKDYKKKIKILQEE